MNTPLSAVAIAGVLGLFLADPAPAAELPAVVATSRCQLVDGSATVIAVSPVAEDHPFSLEEFRRGVLARYDCLPGTQTVTTKRLDD
jgi:hypothetical protein